VLAPNGYEQLSAGVPTTVTWREFGLGLADTIGLINSAGPTVDNWLADAYRTQTYGTSTNGNTIDRSLVNNPAPMQVYQTYQYAQGPVGSEIAYTLPVPDGNYTLRLHFAEPQVGGANQRTFDIKVNGVVVQSGYDIYAAAGNSRNKAVAVSFNVSAAGGSGLNIELVTKDTLGWPAIISGLELTQGAAGVASPKVDLQYSLNGGGTWTTFATGLTMDNYGRGSYQWTPPSASNNALIRVDSDDFP